MFWTKIDSQSITKLLNVSLKTILSSSILNGKLFVTVKEIDPDLTLILSILST